MNTPARLRIAASLRPNVKAVEASEYPRLNTFWLMYVITACELLANTRLALLPVVKPDTVLDVK